jgi:hypothetical protein
MINVDLQGTGRTASPKAQATVPCISIVSAEAVLFHIIFDRDNKFDYSPQIALFTIDDCKKAPDNRVVSE